MSTIVCKDCGCLVATKYFDDHVQFHGVIEHAVDLLTTTAKLAISLTSEPE